MGLYQVALHVDLLVDVRLQEAVVVAHQQIKTPKAQDNEEHVCEVLANHVGAGHDRVRRLDDHLPHPLAQRRPLHFRGRCHRLDLDVDGVLQHLARLVDVHPKRLALASATAHARLGQLGLQFLNVRLLLLQGAPGGLTAHLAGHGLADVRRPLDRAFR